VEFVRAAGVKSDVIYIYDGAKIDTSRYQGWNPDMLRNDSSYGAQSNPKVWVMREFVNSDANHLGMPLPREGCASTAATPTGGSSSPARTPSITRPRMKRFASSPAPRST